MCVETCRDIGELFPQLWRLRIANYFRASFLHRPAFYGLKRAYFDELEFRCGNNLRGVSYSAPHRYLRGRIAGRRIGRNVSPVIESMFAEEGYLWRAPY